MTRALYCQPAYFNLHAEYIIRNARLDESQARVKIDGRNINNFRYEDDTTLKAESEGIKEPRRKAMTNLM